MTNVELRRERKKKVRNRGSCINGKLECEKIGVLEYWGIVFSIVPSFRLKYLSSGKMITTKTKIRGKLQNYEK